MDVLSSNDRAENYWQHPSSDYLQNVLAERVRWRLLLVATARSTSTRPGMVGREKEIRPVPNQSCPVAVSLWLLQMVAAERARRRVAF